MSLPSPRLRPRARATLSALACGIVVWGCTDGAGVTDGSRAVPLDLVPQYQVVAVPFPSGPIDRVRLRAIEVATARVVANTDQAVDPAAREWILSLGVSLGGASSLRVFVEIELFSGETVEWSGRSAPFQVRPGPTPTARVIDVFRGPLGNLDVVSLEIGDAPARLLAGTSATLTAAVTLVEGSTAQPIVYWVAEDGDVAAVGDRGASVTVTAGTPGVTEIFAGAGRASDAVTLEVLPRVSEVRVTPDAVTLDGLALTTQLAAEVIDGFGQPDPTVPVSWTSRDPSVATVDAAGLVTTTGFGVAQVDATAEGVIGSATLTVRGPDLVPTAFSVVPDLSGEIQSLVDTEFTVDVENAGPVAAGTSTLQIRVLDAVTGLEAHPPLAFAVPALTAGATATVQELGGDQVRTLGLPAAIRFEAVVDALDEVAEADESNNVAGAGPFDVRPIAPPGFDVEWRGITVDWGTATNWSTGEVPQPGQSVYIPQTAVDPTLSTSADIDALTVEDGASLTLGSSAALLLRGDVDAGATITGAGVVVLAGSPMQVEGVIDASVLVTGVAVASGPLTLGDVVVEGVGASLRVGGQTVTVPGSFGTNLGGVLIMQDGAGRLQVAGSAVFAGASTAGLLTGGILGVGGDFFAADSDPEAFAPSLAHTVAMEGAGAQRITVAAPGETAQRFVNLVIDNATGVTAATGLVVTGTLDVTAGSVFDAGSVTVSVGGAILDPSGGLDVGVLELIGDITAFPAAMPADVSVLVPVAWPNDATINGNLTVASSLDVGTTTLTVNGDGQVDGSLVVPAGGTVAISAILRLAAGSVFDVDGTVTVGNQCIDLGATILGSGTHPCGPATPTDFTWVGGGAGDPTAWDNPNNWSPSGVPAAGDAVLVSTTASTPRLVANATVASLTVTNGAQIDQGGFSLTVAGDVDALAGALVNGTTILGGPGTVGGTFDALQVGGDRTVVGELNTGGDLTVLGADLDANGRTVAVGAGLTVGGVDGRLLMTVPGSAVDVAGDVRFDGDSHLNALTEGTLFVGGTFTATVSDPLAFVAVGNHTVVFDGVGDQAVTVAQPTATGQRFRNVRFAGASAVTWLSDVAVIGSITVEGAGVEASDDALLLSGDLIDLDGLLNVREIRIVGNLGAFPASVTADVSVESNNTLAQNLNVVGSLALSRSLVVGGRTLSVSGDLSVTGSGLLGMTDPADVVDVEGTMRVDGGAGGMSAGTLFLGGDLTSSSTGTRFLASGTHQTVFDGGGTQTIAFQSGPLNRFRNVSFRGPGNVLLGSDFTVEGAMEVQSGVLVDGADDEITLRGSLDDPTTGLRLRSLRIEAGTTTLPPLIVADVALWSAYSLLAGLEVNGSFTSNNFDLDLDGQELRVTGDVTFIGGRLVMRDVGGLLDVEGDLLFNQSQPHVGLLTEGEIRVGGNFNWGSANAFQPDGGHTLVLDGAAAQTADLSIPDAATQRYNILRVENPAGATMVDDAFVDGNVEVTGQWIIPANTTTAIAAGLTLQAGSVLNVDGTLTAAAGCTNNGGTITGTGTQPCTAPQSSRVWVGGDAAGPRAWENAANWLPTGVPGPDDDVLVDTPTNTPVLSADAPVGSLVVGTDSSVDLGGFTLAVQGDLDGQGLVQNGLVELTGTGTVLRGTVDALRISANRTLSGPLTASAVTLNNNDLTVGPNTLTVNGDLAVNFSGAQLVMQNDLSVVDVSDNVVFSGGTHDGFLTQGVLFVGGDLTATGASSATDFVSTDGHTTVLDGANRVQTIDMATPETTRQRFNNLTIANFTDPVSFASTVFVMGTLFADDVVLQRGAAGVVVEARGIAEVNQTTFLGLPLRLTTQQPGTAHTLDGVAFEAMALDEVQLYLELPGGGNFPLGMQTPTFAPTNNNLGGWHVEMQRGPGGFPTENFVLQLVAPNPNPPLVLQGEGTQVQIF